MSKAAELAALIGSQTALSNRNLIINGAMQVAQRGTSSTSSGIYTIDRWSNSFGGASVTQTQESLSSGSPYDSGFKNFARLQVTTASNLAGDFAQFLQQIEAQNIANSGWNFKSPNSYIVLSFWARSSLAGTYSFWLRSGDGTLQSFSHNFSLSANTWTKITKSIPGNSSIQIDNDNGIGLGVYIVPHYGTTYTTSSHTSDAWQTYSGSDIMADYAQTWTNTLNATFDVTGVQLELGEQATPFEHRSYGDEFSKCCRYYQEATYLGGGAVTIGHQSSTSGVQGDIDFPHGHMRTAPTITLPTAGQGSGLITFLLKTTGYPTTTGTHDASRINTHQFFVNGTSYAGLDGGGLASWFYTGSTGGTVTFKYDAEL